MGLKMKIEKNIRINKLLDSYGNLLTEKQQCAMQNYYAFDYSLAEIGEILNISRQAVNDAIKQGVESLEKFESKLGLLKKIDAIKNYTEKLDQNEKQVANNIIDILEG